MKVALVYDRINKWGGAERLLLTLHKMFPNADLYTSVLNQEKAPWAKHFRKIETSFLQKFPRASSSHELYATLMPLAFESFNFDDYDLVISVTSEAAKGIITKPQTKHICICLTPTRYLWSGYDIYFKNSVLRFLSGPAVSYLRKWDKIAAMRPDAYIAISKGVQGRIKKYYGRNSTVIYPPVTFWGSAARYPSRGARLATASSNSLRAAGIPSSRVTPQGYFLIVSRLVPYKKVEIAVRAFNKLKIPLKIIGTGSQEGYLKRIASKNIEFLDQVTDDELEMYYSNCKALIFPGSEDFGLVMVESQSFGKPVIAYRGGGALEIVREGETGEFFDEQKPDSLAKIVEKWDDKRYNSSLCVENSERFSFENFKKEIEGFIKDNL